MPNVNETDFDRVHDTQQIYRMLLEALSRPGSVNHLSLAFKSIDAPPHVSKVATAIAYTLLDGELGFTVQMTGQEQLAETIRRMTYSKIVDYSAADFLFLDGDATAFIVDEIESKVKVGTLSSPEKAATLFIRVKACATQ